MARASSAGRPVRLIVARCEVTYSGRLDAVLPEAVRLEGDVARALEGAELALVATPTSALRETLARVADAGELKACVFSRLVAGSARRHSSRPSSP